MAKHEQHSRTTGMVGALVAALGITAGAVAATPLSGSVSGPVASVKGSSFTVTTSLSPTGRSTVVLSSAATITKQESGTRASLRNGVCLLATGTTRGSSVVATRIVIRGSCASAPGGPSGGARPGGGIPGGGGGVGSRPANFAVATGAISAVKGSTLTIKGKTGSTSVNLSSSTQILRTVTVKPSAITVSECALVRGTSSDGGVEVKADAVSLSAQSKTGCTTPFAHA